MTKIACAQFDPKLFEVSSNLMKMEGMAREAAAAGARLVIFPECATTGYCIGSKDEALKVAEPIPGPTTKRLEGLCRELGIYIIFGMIESVKNDVYNSAVLAGPKGFVSNYRKVHLPMVGLDRFAKHGDIPFKVHDTELGRIGVIICYDVGFPEPARVLRLQGADLIAVPTNWPYTSTSMPSFVVPTRAIENHVNVAACNRCGTERGIRFIGTSLMVDHFGKELGKAGETDERLVFADMDLKGARESFTTLIPGVFTADRIADRRPEFYGEIIKKKS